MSPPLIGITTRRLASAHLAGIPLGVADAELEAVFADYADSVSGAGGLPVNIPRSASIPDLVDRLDGIVLSGGEDVSPHRYGGVVGPSATAHDPARDEFESVLIEAALARNLPILAICRGVQILNVTLGGTLVEHLDDTRGFSHSRTDDHRSARRHLVSVVPGTLLASAVASGLDPDGSMRVNSYHHQAVQQPGAGLTVVAVADDGTIEAIELPGRPVLGVQWHPEMHPGIDPVFGWLVEAAELAAQQRETSRT